MLAAADSKTKFVFKLPFKIVSEEQSYNKRRNHRGEKCCIIVTFCHMSSLSLYHTRASQPSIHQHTKSCGYLYLVLTCNTDLVEF